MTDIDRSIASNYDGENNQTSTITTSPLKSNKDSAHLNRNSHLQKLNGRSNSGSSSTSTGCEVNYCEVYYLSPSKRKPMNNYSNPLTQQHQKQQQQQLENTKIMSRKNSAQKRSRQEPISILNNAQQQQQQSQPHQIPMTTTDNIFALTSYTHQQHNSQQQHQQPPSQHHPVLSRQMPVVCDPNFDQYEVRSHFSDSAATIGQHNMNNIFGSGSRHRNRNNNTVVTFSNCTEERIHSNHSVGGGSSRNGSLKRAKGRSNQSLCSCDADTELIPNPTNRPLYQYSLDRRNKSHTYTCEQNAQILMRLMERKQQQGTSGTGNSGSSALLVCGAGGSGGTAGDIINSKQINDSRDILNESRENSSFEYPQPKTTTMSAGMTITGAYQDTSSGLESDSLTEVDSIPPPPPPVSANRSKQFSSSAQTYRHHQQNFIKDFTNTIMGTKQTESLLNDCTATILNCANVGQTVSSVVTNSIGGTGISAGKTTPDLCNVQKSSNSRIFSEQDTWRKSNQENIPLGSYPNYAKDDSYVPCFKGIGKGAEDSVFFYHQEPAQFAPNFDNRPNSGKYNTIGPGNYCAKQFSHYNSGEGGGVCNSSSNFNSFADNFSNGGRYFSQSLTNFSNFGAQGEPEGNFHHNQSQQRSHLRPSSGGHNHDFAASNTPYTQFRTSSSLNGLNRSFTESAMIGSTYTSTGSISSTLKGKLQQQQQNSSSMPWRHRQCPSRGSSSSGTNSFRFDPSRHWLAVSSILLIVGAASVAVPLALRVAASAPFDERLQAATQLLDAVPLIDGHNDLPWNIRKFLHNKLNDFNFDEDLRTVMPWARSHWSHTDLQRLKKGRVAAQFWAAYVPCEAQHRDAVQLTLEQIDVIKRLTERYSPQLTTCTSASEIIEAHKNHQVCSLTGVEGGHSLGGSLAVLRTLYAIGVRYMTLTSTCHTPWADSSHADAPKYDVKHGGLTVFGKTIIREMNRLGMIVDLSHVSVGTMRDALSTSEAPVIFSHSSAYELCNSSRNVQDDILQLVAKNGGLVMVNFYSKFLSCSENSTVHDAVAHINHIRKMAGIDHVGLGAGFDGINFTPKGLEDVSTYPTLFAELLGEGWSIEELTKLAGQNFLRVMTEVEKIRDDKKLAGQRPFEDHPNFRTEDPYNCTSS